jgi:competence protein ComEA
MRRAGALRGIATFALAWVLAAPVLALDANRATVTELEALQGIGPALAARIVEARRARPFSDLEDLAVRVRGIGDAKLRRLRAAGLVVGNAGHVQRFVGQPAEVRPKRSKPAKSARTGAAPGARPE